MRALARIHTHTHTMKQTRKEEIWWGGEGDKRIMGSDFDKKIFLCVCLYVCEIVKEWINFERNKGKKRKQCYGNGITHYANLEVIFSTGLTCAVIHSGC